MIKSFLKGKKWLVGASLALASLGVGGSVGAVGFNNNFAVSRFNTAGSNFVNMTSSSTSFCFLTEVSIDETDTGGEFARCRITKGALVWSMEAILDISSDADVGCGAICYNN